MGDIARAVQERLEERDFEDDSFDLTNEVKHQEQPKIDTDRLHRSEWSDRQRDDHQRRSTIRDVVAASKAVDDGMAKYLPQAPAIYEDNLRKEISNVLNFRKQPLALQQSEAMAHRMLKENQTAAKHFGLEPPKNATEALALQRAMDEEAERQAQGQYWAQRQDQVQALQPFMELAEKSGTTLPEALQKYVDAEQLLEREPVKGIAWLAKNYGVHPAQLDPKTLEVENWCRRNLGATANQAVTNYAHAEAYLRKDPVGGFIWICKSYGLDPRQVAQAMLKRR